MKLELQDRRHRTKEDREVDSTSDGGMNCGDI